MYLPNNDNSEEYHSALVDVLCVISEIIDQDTGYDDVVTGDFNSEFSKATWSFTTLSELFDEYTGWPNKNRNFMRYHIFAAITDIIIRFY